MNAATELENVLGARVRAAERATRAVRTLEGAEARATDAVRRSIGPYQQLVRLQRELADAAASGKADGAYVSDLNYLADRARRRVQAAQPATGAQRFGQALATSRFAAGPIAPMVGKAAEALGADAAAAAGPVGIMIAVASGLQQAAAKLREMTDESARVTREFSSLRVETGASTREAARLRAFGVSGDVSARIGQRISSDPAAMGLASRMGARVIGGPFGTLDNARATLQIVRELRGMREDAQQRALRILDAPELAPLLKLSDATFRRLERDARRDENVFTPERERASQEYETSKQRLGRSSERLWAQLTGRPMRDLTNLQNAAADSLGGASEGASRGRRGSGDALYNAGRFSLGAALKSNPLTAPLGVLVDFAAGLDVFGVGRGGRPAGAAAQQQQAGGTADLAFASAALLQVARSMEGDRARGAVPPELRNIPGEFHLALEQGALRLGALG